MLSALNNLKIGAKLGVLTGVNLALLVITAIAASVFMIQIGNELKEVAHKDIPITEKLTQLTTHQLEQAIEYERALRMASGGSSQAREKFENAEKRFSELSTKADQEIIELQGMLNDAVVSAGSDKAKAELTDILNRMEGVKANHQKYEEHVDEVFNLISRGLFSEAERLEADIEEEQLALNNELTALLVKIGDFTENALLSVEAHESTALTVMVVLGVIALAIGIGFSIIVTKGISKPIDSFVEAIRLLSGGDTRVAIPCLEQSDEIGDMARGVESIRLSANENMRIRNALDNCQANVMLADPDLNIVYMNNTMVAMMKNAEADL
ncbi:Tar ligand binding domain-containing protein, partial [Aestuariispira insulae]|uniref:Tar ligand binding domain-containing protein n=1 Tax=Aestuariispira insulae TaxID=1461337 RepID=UPI000E220DD3